MKTYVRATAAALILVGLTTACQRTTEGSVAMTTEPGPPLTTTTRTPSTTVPGLPDFEIPGLPIPNLPLPSDAPVVPPPPNALTMTCEEFNGLDEATKLAVIREILKQENSPLGPDGEGAGWLLVEAACQFLPDATVSEVLLGPSPP